MLPDEKVMCHHTAFEKRCFDMVVHSKCPKWVMIAGVNPNTGEQINRHSCADSIAHLLMIENSSLLNQVAAALHSERNEIVKRLDVANVQAADLRLIARRDFNEGSRPALVAETMKMIENKSDG